MNKNTKFFLLAFVLSLPFWWGINIFSKNLENLFYWQKIVQNPEMLTAQVNQNLLKAEIVQPIVLRNRNVENLEISANSAISVFVKNDGQEQILFAKEIEKSLPIASLTKLMTANIVLENYDLSKEIKISKTAVEQPENLGQLEEGKIFSVKYLLYPLLMESSNDAAFALSNDYDGMTEEKFVELMNLSAQKMNLENTFFTNATGLDPKTLETETNSAGSQSYNWINYSTANDLAKFIKELLNPIRKSEISNGAGNPLIWEILSTPTFNLYGPELKNTNEFLTKELTWRSKIVGGKTGNTETAGGCMILVLKAPQNDGYLINVILGSPDRFAEMEKLVNWINSAYQWQ